MRVRFFDDQGAWRTGDALWEALWLEERLRGNGGAAPSPSGARPFMICAVGAGGKTSLIRRLAFEGRARGLRVLVSTTTHMYLPQRFGVLEPDLDAVESLLVSEGLAVVGSPGPREKMAAPDEAFFRKACALAQLVLVEADGSRRLPLKAPGPHEPVIPPECALTLCVLGLSGLGRSGGEVCFRLEEAEKLAPGIAGRPVEADDLGRLLAGGYLAPLRGQGLGGKLVPVFSQADTPELEKTARELLEKLGERGGLAVSGLRTDASFGLF